MLHIDSVEYLADFKPPEPAPQGSACNLQIGDRVAVTHHLQRWIAGSRKEQHARYWYRVPLFDNPNDLLEGAQVPVYVVGLRTLQSGTYIPGYRGSGFFEDEPEAPTFQVTQTHRVAIVTEGIRSKHFVVLTDDILTIKR
jgi:hypothetical protein